MTTQSVQAVAVKNYSTCARIAASIKAKNLQELRPKAERGIQKTYHKILGNNHCSYKYKLM